MEGDQEMEGVGTRGKSRGQKKKKRKRIKICYVHAPTSYEKCDHLIL